MIVKIVQNNSDMQRTVELIDCGTLSYIAFPHNDPFHLNLFSQEGEFLCLKELTPPAEVYIMKNGKTVDTINLPKSDRMEVKIKSINNF